MKTKQMHSYSRTLKIETGAKFTHCGLELTGIGEHQHFMDKYEIELCGQSFDYWMGIGHRKYQKLAYIAQYPKYERECLQTRWKDSTSPKVRAIYEKFTEAEKSFDIDYLLSSLHLDSRAMSQSFEDWRCELGFDTDSRKALETYLECQQLGVKWRQVMNALKITEEAAEKLLDF